MVRRVVAVRGPRDQHVPIVQDQARALVLRSWIERDLRAVTVARRTCHGGLNFHRAAGIFCERPGIQSVQELHDAAA